MKEDGIEMILIILFFILIFLMAIIIYDGNNYIYKCIDYEQNVIYCRNVRVEKGNAWGEMEDGTNIAITSYKKISKKERSE